MRVGISAHAGANFYFFVSAAPDSRPTAGNNWQIRI
jgi:hypothetical protein